MTKKEQSDTQRAFRSGFIGGSMEGMLFARKKTAKEFAEKLKIKAIRLSEIENYHVCNLIDELLKEYEK